MDTGSMAMMVFWTTKEFVGSKFVCMLVLIAVWVYPRCIRIKDLGMDAKTSFRKVWVSFFDSTVGQGCA